jgi:predicted outer membrane repeat protein
MHYLKTILLLIIIFLTSINTSTFAHTFFHEDFETNTNKWSVVQLYGAENTWAVGSATAFSGNKSAYISNDNGQSASYNPNIETIVSYQIPIDLSLCDEKPVLSFWYKYDGEPLYNKDIGNVFINNQLIEFDEQLDSTLDWKFIEQELPNNFPGKKIVLKFQWKNDSETGQNPGFCIDEIKIEGELISGPVFTSESILNVRVGEEFEHLITTANAESQDVTIDLWSNWMTLTNENPSKGTAIIQGVPHEAYEDKEKTVLLIATTQTNKTTKRLKIRVLKRLFVTNHNDSGDGSLRDALEKSSSLAYPADIIITEPGTITLQSDQLNINHSCFITGPGADKLFISGNHSFRIFEIGQNCQVSISGVCIQNGNSSFPGAIVYSGAGILVPPSSELELHNCIIENNFSSKYGGGIYSTGKLMMKNCILRHNQAQQGGGLFYNTLFDTLVINNCQVFQNTSSTYGAGIFITNTYSATNNSSATYPDLTIENTSIMNNQTDGSGGGIFSQRSILNLKNVFICDNSAVTHGGGIVSSHALLRTTHSTIANNYCTADGGGIYNENNSVIYIRNSIIAQNDSHTSYPNIYGDVFSKGYNIISTLMKASFHSNTIGDIYYDPYDLTDPHPGALELSKSVDPMLLPVKQSDGQTHFYAIDWGSSAIDSGICSDLNNEPIHMDFRGIMRPQNGIPEKPSECDIGAYEASILLKATPTSTALPDQPYAFTITTIPDASLLSITMIGLPDWLTLSDDIDGNVIIHGYPDISSSGFYPMTLIVSNQAEYISRPFILTVPFFYENFENKLHDNWQLPEVSETQNFWMIGNHVSKSGQQSAYISYIGTNTASYLSKSCMSVMSLNADLRFIHSPKLKFYWKCKGDSTDYGSIQIKRINGQIQSINKKFNNNSELWQEELVDLSNVEGEKVQILFVWQNNGYANSAPGFCIDEVQLLGTKTQYPIVDKPVFATTPPVIALPEKTYTHMLMVEDYNDDSITITLKESPEWLQFTSLVSENGHALLTGKPSHKDIGLHPVIIMASDNINDVTLSYMINVPVFFDSFETGFSENWSIINGQHLDNRWTTGHATSKHGNQSAYISYDRGQSAAYQPGADQQILSFHADLSLILNPFIQFWWKCGGIQNRQYGEVTIVFNDNVIPLSQPMEFNFSEFWKQKYIDLSKYSGKIIDIQFIWKNASSGYQNNPPFCVDDIEIGGTISQSPALTGPKEYSVVPGKPLAYTITFADFKSSDLDIKCHHLPDWLTYQQIDKSSIVFKAVTEILPSGFFDFTVTASNGAYQTVEQINILVPVFYENFEQASSINMRTYQQPTKAVNQWHIGSESAFSGDQAAYISSDNGISSGFQLSEISRAYMEIPVDLTYCLDPHLFFQWKTDTAVLYGHGELLIMGEDQPLTIKPFTRSKDWQEYSVYLNQFKGEKIILRYAWINDSVKHQHKEPAFCIDDIKIFSPVRLLFMGLITPQHLSTPHFPVLILEKMCKRKKQHSLEDMQLIQMKSHSCRQIFNWLTMH